MAGIVIYNRFKEDHSKEQFNFPTFSGPFKNPYSYTHRVSPAYRVHNNEEAIKRYDSFFDLMYKQNDAFKELVDVLYDAYKAGITIYLETDCYPETSSADIISKKIQQRLMKEKINQLKNK